jgi:predicted enzyme related to lactoylglutathione lyase
MGPIKYSMPVLFVKDIEISKTFYQELFALKIENDFGENIVFKDGFSLWQKKRAEDIIFNSDQRVNPHERKNVELYFETQDIEQIWIKIKKKAIDFIHGLREEPWGQRNLRFYDPDKYIIEIAEPMEEVVLRLSKAGKTEEEISNRTQMPLEAVIKILKENN